ncbi:MULTISPECIES: HDOD domain-containing protein [Alteromonadaceae]|jgi:EAL and modified HD-GYP domain-containing signal transduction protein|uniref:HDOD domain-containing protein n=1 Tax=Brumicola blandensis TaxID=3075611 RepID=A0AAW8R259_9ALTE|nr:MULTISPECIES: HDOD domain-containing protein [unclassified Alteromonas]MDT0582397.1 HDOD domain-containing protein [Alteromonas sp. W409]MDT0628619.1 HDOD domain-containing protein [Alteromonas sp. W364]
MFAFIARQPILDKEQDLFAYELLFRDGASGAYPLHEPKKAELITERFSTLGIDDISGNQKAFINFLPETIINRFPEELSADNVVVELTQNPAINTSLMNACEHLKQQGYKLALSDDKLESTILTPYPYIDIVKVDITKIKPEWLEQHIPTLAASGIQLVAEQVASLDQFAMCRDLGFDYFQGYFFTQPDTKSAKALPASKLTMLELMSQSAQPEFDLESVASIIERDAALSYLLLRFINNPMVNKRLKITSLRHALTYLGEVEVKKFIALLSLASLNDSKPLELLQVSLVRAKFCELFEEKKNGKDKSMSAFIVGLFSLLDTILDSEMPVILEKLPVSKGIKQALLGEACTFTDYLSTAKAFESGLWGIVISQSESLDISQKDLHEIFNRAIKWSNEMRQALSDFFPRATPNGKQ